MSIKHELSKIDLFFYSEKRAINHDIEMNQRINMRVRLTSVVSRLMP